MLAVAAALLLTLAPGDGPPWHAWRRSLDPADLFLRGVPDRGDDAYGTWEHPRPSGPVRRVVWSQPGWGGEPGQPRATFEFDEQGRTTLIELWDPVYRVVRERTVLHRTARETRIEHAAYRRRPVQAEEPDRTTTRVWRFDEEGRALSCERLLDDGRPLVEVRLGYDDQGRIATRTELGEDGSVEDVLEARYDPRGRMHAILYGRGPEAPRLLYRLEHDLGDRTTAVLDADGEVLWRNTYDGDGLLETHWRGARDAGRSSVGESIVELTRDEHGTVVEEQGLGFAASGGLKSRTVTTYVGGRLLHSISVDVTGFVRGEAAYDYELDPRGNWVVRIARPSRPQMPSARKRERTPQAIRTIDYRD